MKYKVKGAMNHFGMIILLGWWILPGLSPYSAFAGDEYLIPGDVRKGWRIFATKGCIQCHSMEKEGKSIGPDLSKTPFAHLSAAGLAADMWNHAPDMWTNISAKGIEYKKLDQAEMADLFAFLYFIRYLDEPGNPAKGKEVLREKRCTECHGIGGKEGKVGPDLAEWAQYTNPILWVQMMWNHAMEMKEEMQEEAISWPKLEGDDVVNIIAYIRSGKPSGEKVFLAPGDPAEGKILFSKKGCETCHAIRGKGGKRGPDLGVQKKDFPPTLARLAGLMWNHFPEMLKEMQKQKMKMPKLSAKDMANITAYLFSIRYFDPAGDQVSGREVFQKRQCHLCHQSNKHVKKETEGPNLSKLQGKVSPIYMAKALWNHGPKMIAKMKKKNIEWQKLTRKELVDIMEYLNRGG